jgi:oligopeptidase B
VSDPPIAKALSFPDPYSWLRDRSDPDVLVYLEAENAYTDEVMKPAAALQQELYDEILGRIKEDDTSVPVKNGDWLYYNRTEKGKPYPIHCRKALSPDAPEHVILDSNQLAEGHEYFRLGALAASPDHHLLVYGTDVLGDETFTLRVKDLRTGELLPDEILNAYYSLAWANDNRTLFYTVLDETKRPYRVYRHELGTPIDTLVYEETDARFELNIEKSRSHRYIFLTSESPLTSEVRYLPAAHPASEPRIVVTRNTGVEYDVEHQGSWLYIRTNDGARNFRLMRTPVSDPSEHNWEEIIAGRDDATIEDVQGFRDFLILVQRVNGLETIGIAPANDVTSFEPIEFPEPVYTVGVGANPEYDSKILRFTYTSLVTPPSVFDFNMETRQRELKKQQEVLGGYDPSLYKSERLFASAPDGVKVPISLVYRKDLAAQRPSPMLLYGYGAYGLTTDPAFGSDRLSLLDRGFIFAMAHIRGGGDMGKWWHESGKLLTKKNTFTDFIACAEHLIELGSTASNRLAILGGSAGGLLMGAVTNMRPDLFHVVIAKVPFVDAVNTMLDPTLPLTITEYEEWGNPEQSEYFEYIRAYSPYDNVEAKAYPAMLVKGGLNDPRVAYWEPAKWVAKLRAMKTDRNLLLLKTNMGAGHFGPSGRYQGIRETAFDYAFLLSRLC